MKEQLFGKEKLPMLKFTVGILGATGSVGQRFIQLLESHPWFEITALVASEQSAGKKYKHAVKWKQTSPIPGNLAEMTVKKPTDRISCDFVFSGLDSSVAGSIEEDFASRGYPVISNSKNHRMDTDVPLLIPEVNPQHIALIDNQKKKRGYTRGFIVTNPNCSVIGLTMVLKPLHDAFGLEKIHVTTMQALSGAGFPGVASMDIVDNVIPYISDEEEKIESEPLKLLGVYEQTKIHYADIKISAQANRVGVTDGHTEAVSIKLKTKTTVDEIKKTLQSFTALPQKLKLPTAPDKPIIFHSILDRPQPRLDRDLGYGMTVSVGRLRDCPILDYKFIVLSHNTIRGAAGAAILNAELLVKKEYIKSQDLL